MSRPLLEVMSAGLGLSLQDGGRPGWARFGVPPSGWMDRHAARWANRLLDNPSGAPVLELQLHGVRLRVREHVWIAVTGADGRPNVPLWEVTEMHDGDILEFPHGRSGVWTYLGVAGGFDGARWLGSVSSYPRASLGQSYRAGDMIQGSPSPNFQLPPSVAGRWTNPKERRDYLHPPALRIWPGPQWEKFAPSERVRFFGQRWLVTSQCDRVGYRLAGEPIKSEVVEVLSEPVRVGSIQVPGEGQPVVTMRDGPTVGGYPKLGMIDPEDICWLSQVRAGQCITFVPHDGVL